MSEVVEETFIDPRFRQSGIECDFPVLDLLPAFLTGNTCVSVSEEEYSLWGVSNGACQDVVDYALDIRPKCILQTLLIQWLGWIDSIHYRAEYVYPDFTSLVEGL